jgi:hypothetical protein
VSRTASLCSELPSCDMRCTPAVEEEDYKVMYSIDSIYQTFNNRYSPNLSSFYLLSGCDHHAAGLTNVQLVTAGGATVTESRSGCSTHPSRHRYRPPKQGHLKEPSCCQKLLETSHNLTTTSDNLLLMVNGRMKEISMGMVFTTIKTILGMRKFVKIMGK